MRIIAFCGFLAIAAIATIASVGREVLVTVERVVDVGIDFCMAPFRLDYGAAARVIQRWVIAAFRVLGMLKPEYDESFESDGQNFAPRVGFASRC